MLKWNKLLLYYINYVCMCIQNSHNSTGFVNIIIKAYVNGRQTVSYMCVESVCVLDYR